MMTVMMPTMTMMNDDGDENDDDDHGDAATADKPGDTVTHRR